MYGIFWVQFDIRYVFDKKTGSGVNVNEVIAQEFHKPVIQNFKSRKVYARFKDNIWAVDLAEIGSLSSKNHGINYLLCVIDVFTKYAWLKPLTISKKLKQFLMVYWIANESKRQPNNLWIDHGREFTITLCKNG